ncbi:hypothetical protein ALT721_940016 [Alteromonas alvinellae]
MEALGDLLRGASVCPQGIAQSTHTMSFDMSVSERVSVHNQRKFTSSQSIKQKSP